MCKLTQSSANLKIAVGNYVDSPGERELGNVLRRAAHVFSAGRAEDSEATDQDLLMIVQEEAISFVPEDRQDLRQFLREALEKAAAEYLAKSGANQTKEVLEEPANELKLHEEPPQTLDQAWEVLCNLQAIRGRFLGNPVELARHRLVMRGAFVTLALMDGGDARLLAELDVMLEEVKVHPKAVSWFVRMLRERDFRITHRQRERSHQYEDEYKIRRFQEKLERRRRQLEKLRLELAEVQELLRSNISRQKNN